MSARTRAYVMLLTVVLIWGIAPPIIKPALNYLPPNLFLTYRFAISSLISLPFLIFGYKTLIHRLSTLTLNQWLILIINGVLGSTLNIGPLFWGLASTSSLEASVLSSLSPLFVALAAYLFLHEHLSLVKKVGYALAVIGTILLVIEPVLTRTYTVTSGSIMGNSLILLGDLTWAVYIVISKKHLRMHLSPFFLTFNMFFWGFISMTIITLFSLKSYQLSTLLSTAPLFAHLSVWYMATLSGTLAYFLFQDASKTIAVSEANLFLYLSPIFTLPISYFVLHEPVSFILIISSLIIACGVLFAEIRRR